MFAYLFDVDGVLADPVEKQVTKKELFDELIIRLRHGEPIGLNTGRSTAWMVERIIDPLIDRLDDVSLLENFVAIGEKGGTWISFSNTGEKLHGQDETIRMPAALIAEAQKLVEEKYNDVVFFDKTKETMVSIEMHDKFDLGIFQQKQKELNHDLEVLLERHHMRDKFKIDPTTIATDVENAHVGKALGVVRFLHFLEERGFSPDKYITFGDSASDLEMADELQRRNKDVTFVYVGSQEDYEKAKRDGKIKDESIIRNVGNYSQGTLEYLQNDSSSLSR